MPAKTLRAVAPGEMAPPSKPKSVAQAAASGNHRELLVAMRERLATAVSNPDCPPRDLAALTRRLQDIAKEIESIDLRLSQESEASSNGPVDDSFDPSTL